VVSGSPGENIPFTNCEGILGDEGKERGWVLCASAKGLGSGAASAAGTGEGSSWCFTGRWRKASLLESEDIYPGMLWLILEDFSLWLSIGD